MESNIFKNKKKKQNDPIFENSRKIQPFTLETLLDRSSIVKDKNHFRKFPGNDAFLRKPPSQKQGDGRSKYTSPTDNTFGKSYPEQNMKPEKLTDSSQSSIEEQSFDYDQNTNYQPSAPSLERNDSIINQKLDHQQKEHVQPKSVDTKIFTSSVNYDSPQMYTNDHEPSGREAFVRPMYDINKNSTFVCKAVNYTGEPVTINNQTIRNKLILSCRPTSYSPEGKPLHVDTEENFSPVHSSPDVFNIQPADLIPQMKPLVNSEKRAYSLQRSNAIDLGSLGLGYQGLQTKSEKERFGQQQKTKLCNKYKRRFKNYLWVLFLVNMLLLVAGVAFLFLTLTHFLFKSYVNTVLNQTGYVIWLWAALGLALIIILVALYGIATSLYRTEKMLISFIILALILALVILIFVVLYWLSKESLLGSGMVDSFHKYRCHRWAHVAWNDLHENFRCCGVESSGDWKYIPPSCCNATIKEEKIRCIGYFISEDQAFERGCQKQLEKYFSWMFFIINCILVLAFLLLVLGILAASRLLKMYKKIHQCREVYFITS